MVIDLTFLVILFKIIFIIRLSVNIQQIPSQNNVQQPTEFEGIPQIIEMQQNLGPRPDGVNVDQMTALDIERLTKGVEKVQAALIPKLEDFNSLLTNPPQKSSIRTTIGVIEKPLGATRLEVIHLIAALLTSNNNKIFEKFSELKTLTTIIVSVKIISNRFLFQTDFYFKQIFIYLLLLCFRSYFSNIHGIIFFMLMLSK